MERPDYVVGVPKAGTYKRLVTTETGEKQVVSYRAKKGECDGRPYRLEIPLRPYESVVFEFPKSRKKKATPKKKTKYKIKLSVVQKNSATDIFLCYDVIDYSVERSCSICACTKMGH